SSTPAVWLPEDETLVGASFAVAETRFIAPEEVEEVEVKMSTPTKRPGPLLPAPPKVEIREELIAMVLRDLMGPVDGPDEELSDQLVHDRYLIGMLAPNDRQIFPEEQDELGDAEEGEEDSGPDTGATQ